MIDSRYLKLVLAIDQFGSLNKASKELNLTQSALSHQLKNLEEYLDLAIFHRVGNQLHFTEAGKELRDRAEHILEQLESLESRLAELREDQLARYIHGYSRKEAQRLIDQASSVADFIHFDSHWEEGSRILEVGCGVGAQTAIIAQKNPNTQFVSIDISKESLQSAQTKIEQLGLTNVSFQLKDVRNLKRRTDGLFDHVLVCFILEHLSDPLEILSKIKAVLKPNGSITVIEGDHGSAYFYPDNPHAQKVIQSQIALQKKRGGDANIGRALFPLLQKAGFKNIEVSPRTIYVDGSKPALVEGFIKNTFTAMIQGMSEEILAEELLSLNDFNKGIDGLLRTAQEGGVFNYTFFKAKALH